MAYNRPTVIKLSRIKSLEVVVSFTGYKRILILIWYYFRIFVYASAQEGGNGGINISLSAPVIVHEKCICFVKTGSASQLHSGNLDDSITCMDWAEPLAHGNMLVRWIFAAELNRNRSNIQS